MKIKTNINIKSLLLASSLVLGGGNVLANNHEDISKQTQEDIQKALVCEEKINNIDLQDDLQKYFHSIRQFLCNDYQGILEKDFIHKDFGFMGLMNMAAALWDVSKSYPQYREEIIEMQEEIIIRFLSKKTSPYGGQELLEVDDLKKHNAYLYNLGLTLAIHYQSTKSDKYLKLYEKITKHLSNEILKSHDGHIREKKDDKKVMPVHTAGALRAIVEYDKIANTNYIVPAKNKWLSSLKKRGYNRQYGLPYSSLYGKENYMPRGSSTGLLIAHLSYVEPKLAKLFYDRYIEHFKLHYMFEYYGFREWPKGKSREEDKYSGSIIFGISTVSTGNAMYATKVLGDNDTHEGVFDLFNFAKDMNFFGNKKAQEMVETTFGSAIILLISSKKIK